MPRTLCYLSIFVCTLFGCATKSNDHQATDDLVTADSTALGVDHSSESGDDLTTAESYRDKIDQLPVNSKSITKALELFQTSFPKENKDTNDHALKYYLEFQAKIIAKLDEELASRRDIDDINALVYGDSTVTSKTARSYVKEMDSNGLKFGSSEGYPFVKPKLELVRKYFYENLNESTQKFFAQYTLESDQELSSDAGIIIPIQQLAERVLFWDDFVSRYPDHIFADHAHEELKMNRYYLMAGMDNTPAYDYETKKLDREFAQAFQFLIANQPNSSSAEILKNLMRILVKHDTTKTDEAEEFIGTYSPY